MNIILKKINTDHYVVVDDLEIKEGDYVLSKLNTIVVFGKKYTPSLYRKITHSTQPIEDYTRADGETIKVYAQIKPLNVSEAKELIGEVDVEKKAEKDRLDTGWGDSANLPYTSGFVRGYTQALEDNKDKKYTEEDIREVVRLSLEDAETSVIWSREWYPQILADRILQSLHPKTEWEIEIVNDKVKLI